MNIREMTKEDCLRVLAGATLARLACAHENQPYVVPVYLAYDAVTGYLYGFTTPGQKVEWMRANPLVCVEVDDVIAYDQWVSVIASGRYEELPETPGIAGAAPRAPERARQVGEATPAWFASLHRQCDDEECHDERKRAWQILKTRPEWAEAGCTTWAARTLRDSPEPFTSVYYRIRIDRVTGHEATPDARDMFCAVPVPAAGKWSWLPRTLTRVLGGRWKVWLKKKMGRRDAACSV